MKKIYFDHNIFQYISKGLREENKKYKDLHTYLYYLKDKKIIQIFYSFSHVYEISKSFTGDNEKIIIDDLINIQLLTDSNQIDYSTNKFIFSKKDPIDLYYDFKQHFDIARDMEILADKYYKLIFLFDQRIIQFDKKEDEELKNLKEKNITDLIDETLIEKTKQFSIKEQKLLINKMQKNLKKYIPDFFDEVYKTIEKHALENAPEDFKQNTKNIFENKKKKALKEIDINKNVHVANIKNFVDSMKNYLNKISVSEQLFPGALQASMDLLKFNPDKKKTKKRKKTIVDKEDMMHFNCASLCDIFVLNDIKFSKRCELVNEVLNNKTEIMNEKEFINYIIDLYKKN